MSPAVKVLGTVVIRRSDGVVVDAGAVPTSKALDLLRLLVGAGEQAHGADHYIAPALADRGRGARPDEPAHRRWRSYGARWVRTWCSGPVIS